MRRGQNPAHEEQKESGGGQSSDQSSREHQAVRILSLADVDCFLVRQHVENMEVLSGGLLETENKYSVLSARNGASKNEYLCEEESGFLIRMLCRNNR